MLMGAFVSMSGVSRELFQRRQRLRRPSARRSRHRDRRGLRRLRGDLRLVGGDRGHVLHRRLSGDAPLRLSAVVLPPASIAAGGTLGRDAAAVDRARGLRRSSRSRTSASCSWPASCRACSRWRCTCITIAIIGRVRPSFLPRRHSAPWRERIARDARCLGAAAAVRLRHRRPLWRPLHAHRGRRRRRRRRLPARRAARQARIAPTSCAALLQATRTAAAVFTVLIGALLFGYFLTITQTPQKLTEFLTGLGIGALRRAGADHADVPGARLPDGRHGDDHPDRADHLPGDHRSSASIRSGSASSSS